MHFSYKKREVQNCIIIIKTYFCLLLYYFMNTKKTLYRLRSITAFVALASILLISCKKDTEDSKTETTYPITGLWIGTYTQDQTPNQSGYDYSFSIYPDGTLLTKGTANDNYTHYSSGTWILTND